MKTPRRIIYCGQFSHECKSTKWAIYITSETKFPDFSIDIVFLVLMFLWFKKKKITSYICVLNFKIHKEPQIKILHCSQKNAFKLKYTI